MLTEILMALDPNLDCIEYEITETQYLFRIHSLLAEMKCPYCQTYSSKVHSVYRREIQDLPIQDKQVLLLIDTRKMFCVNPNCNHKTFAETFDFVERHGKKTKRLVEKILVTSVKLSSLSASTLLKDSSIKVSKSSICDLLKKNTGYGK